MPIFPQLIENAFRTGKSVTRHVELSELGPDFRAKAVALEALISAIAREGLRIELQGNSYISYRTPLGVDYLAGLPGEITRSVNEALDDSTVLIVLARTE